MKGKMESTPQAPGPMNSNVCKACDAPPGEHRPKGAYEDRMASMYAGMPKGMMPASRMPTNGPGRATSYTVPHKHSTRTHKG